MATNGGTGTVLTIDSPPGPVIGVDNSRINRNDFPEGFIFGTGTSSYQVEGAAFTDGKSLSTWDDWTLRYPDRILDGLNGNVAADTYNKYKEDARLMKNLGFDSYRFSISWPRILPGGRSSAGINRAGIAYYNDLIDAILAVGMKPFATLFHWDTPLILEKEYGGFLSRKIVPDFLEFAELCFFEFGDRVQWWTTINEPWTYAFNGYVAGNFPPGTTPNVRALSRSIHYRSGPEPDVNRAAARANTEVRFANSNPPKDAYTVGKNLLLAHAATVKLYRGKFQNHQQGQIGIVLNSHWFEPYNPNSEDDVAAASRAMDFMLGWFLEPVLYGHYPQSMIDFVPPENLPPFTQSEANALKGSVDFVGFNYYTANYTRYDPNSEGEGYSADMRLIFQNERDGVLIGDPTGSHWLFVVPWGIYKHLLHFKNYYTDLPPLYVTENGYPDPNDYKLTASQAVVDPARAKYHQDHLANILAAIKHVGIDVRGYFAWSFCDNFEWSEGYTARFGLVYIDFLNNQTRYPKNSARWFTMFLKWDKSQMPVTTNKRATEEEAQNAKIKRLKASA